MPESRTILEENRVLASRAARIAADAAKAKFVTNHEDKCITELLDFVNKRHEENACEEALGRKNEFGASMPGYNLTPPPLSSNVIFLMTERDILFVGEDAVRVSNAIKEYAADFRTQPLTALDFHHRQVISLVEKGRTEVEDMNGVPFLRLWANHWNDYLRALYTKNIGVTGHVLEQ
jgi:hypothetical protein